MSDKTRHKPRLSPASDLRVKGAFHEVYFPESLEYSDTTHSYTSSSRLVCPQDTLYLSDLIGNKDDSRHRTGGCIVAIIGGLLRRVSR